MGHENSNSNGPFSQSRIRVGCSGWSYDEWVGILYDRPDHKFSQYARVFDIAEIDSTFYKVPPPSMAKGLVMASPSNFTFLPKFNRAITHDKMLGKLGSVDSDLDSFLLFLKPLAASGKLGLSLLQLPPYFKAEDSRFLFDFLSSLGGWVKVAVEFRNPSVINEEVILKLSDYNVPYVAVDEPLLPPYNFVTSDSVYIRMHGHGSKIWFDYKYSDDELKPWVDRVKELENVKSYVLFNNHFHGYAVLNALSFINMLGNLTDSQREVFHRIARSTLVS
ncbi:MAG: DUF72 domain-containing protein [Thermoprotei archaeon]|jgi:uncharacterized protein YecE (DUF72 family)